MICKVKQTEKQTWLEGNESEGQRPNSGRKLRGQGGNVLEDLMDNFATRQGQSFHSKMEPGLSQKVRMQRTNTLH